MTVAIYATVAIFTMAIRADDVVRRYVDSAVVDNLFVRVYMSDSAGTNLITTDQIRYSVFTLTNETAKVYFPVPAYACRMELSDGTGLGVSKSQTGDRLGKKFTELKEISWDVINKRGRNTGGSERPDMVLVRMNKAQLRKLATPAELFEIEDSDRHQLSVQFQVFKSVTDGKSHSFRRVRFPPVEIPVVGKNLKSATE